MDFKMSNYFIVHSRSSGASVFILGLCVIFLSSIFSGGAVAQPATKSMSLIPADYTQFILPDKESRVHKWKKDVRIVVLRSADENKTKVISFIVDFLIQNISKKIKGLDVKAATGTQKNFIILPTSDAQKDMLGRYKNILLQVTRSEERLLDLVRKESVHEYACVSYESSLRGEVVMAFIIVDERLNGNNIGRCLSLKFLDTFGLYGKSKNAKSMLNNKNTIFPTAFDYDVLKVLYDNRIQPNNTYTVLQSKLRTILER